MRGDGGGVRREDDLELEVERRAERRYLELASHLPDFVVALDRSRRFRWVNRAAPGITREQLLSGARLDDYVFDPAERERVSGLIERVFETGEPVEYEVEAYGDGARTAVYWTRVVPAAPVDGEPRVLVLTSNVTRQKEFERALRASEQRYASLLEGLPDYVLELDREHRIRFTNRTRDDLREDVIGRRIDELAMPGMRDEVARRLEHLFATGEEVRWSSESTVDGGSYVVHALRLPADRALVVARDVSRERDAIVKLHASEERLSLALGAARIAVWEVDVAARQIVQIGWSARLPGIEGVTRYEDWLRVIEPEDVERVKTAFTDHLAGRTEQYECEYRMRVAETGETFHVLSRGRVVERPGGARIVAGTLIDVTALRAAEGERRALERHVEHAQRLDSIGLLAGGVAHDFNNLLTVIASGAECAKKLVSQGKSPLEELEHVVEATARAAELTQQLLALGRRSSLDVEIVDVDALVRSVAAMVGRVVPKGIEIALEPSPVRAHVRGDRQRLAQVVLNLCVNARDAMPEGGRLTLRVAADERDVTIEVADTGVGIDERDRARIFEPFFTTKPVGTGTGLGLAVAHGIVQQHGGAIAVESEVGRGTRIRVRLPRSAAELATASRDRAEPPRGGTETVLVADDEPAVLRMAVRTLEGAGYRVIEAGDGAAAVEAFRRHEGRVDLVLLDVLMPRLDGWKAQQEIRRIAPTARVMLTTGYSASVIPSESDVPVLPKPYGPDALLRAIRSALDAHGAEKGG